jgi:hypothetical protein
MDNTLKIVDKYEYHRVRMLPKEIKYNHQLISNFNDLHRCNI